MKRYSTRYQVAGLTVHSNDVPSIGLLARHWILHRGYTNKGSAVCALFASLAVLCLAFPASAQTTDTNSSPAPSSSGKHYTLSPDALAPPAPQIAYAPYGMGRYVGTLTVPQGFSVSRFAANLGDPRFLAVAPNDDVFVVSAGKGHILVLRDENGSGQATRVEDFASGYDMPHGIAFHDGALYIADLRGIWKQPYRDGDMEANGDPVRITAAPDLRNGGEHWTREIAFDSKGRLFLAIGSRADVADDDPLPDASIQLVHSDGTMSTFASGLRNVVGMEFRPGTDELWGTVNERDGLGPETPPDYLAQIREGDFFGWPYAYAGPHPDPVFGTKRPDLVASTKTPDVLFEAHSAPLGIVFYDGKQFPLEYWGDAFVAFHASGPYDAPDGYKIVRVRFQAGKPMGGYEDFATGWMLPGSNPPHIWGTPCGLAIAKDGSLLVADENAVWRIAYTGK